MVNIFVDTNILYDDPFLQGNNKFLLDLALRDEVKIYFSEIVIKEASEILKKRLREIIHDYKVNQSKLKKISRLPLNSPGLERSLIVDDFNAFIKDLELKRKIQILSTTTDNLNLALQDLLDKKAPFFNDKNELKDCLIWYTYAKYATNKGLNKCILLTNNYRDFGDRKGEIHPNLSSLKNNFKLIRSIENLKIELGEIPVLTESEISNNSLAQIKIKEIFQETHIDVLIDHLNDAIDGYYKFYNFDVMPQLRKGIIQVADLHIESLSVQRGHWEKNIQHFFGTINANFKLEIYETNSKRIRNGSRITLIEVDNKPFLFDFEVIVNNKNYIEYLEISNLTEVRESFFDNDLPF